MAVETPLTFPFYWIMFVCGCFLRSGQLIDDYIADKRISPHIGTIQMIHPPAHMDGQQG